MAPLGKATEHLQLQDISEIAKVKHLALLSPPK